MPNRGDKMYRIGQSSEPCSVFCNPHPVGNDRCVLETVTFIEEGLSEPSCTVTTYLMRETNGRRFRCSKEMYVTTAKEAWQRHLESCQQSLPANVKAVDDAQKQLDWLNREISRVDHLLKLL
jgi:hypothetical protein